LQGKTPSRSSIYRDKPKLDTGRGLSYQEVALMLVYLKDVARMEARQQGFQAFNQAIPPGEGSQIWIMIISSVIDH